ncbi:ribonuclease H-like domain-containing protein [Phyllosticta paracitricarpa]|uniref:Ribonuclease H-like domain-containing protein n=2 Tax=Phyllosticta TaxID=121621 RepID=A0ABR1NLH0_9PEZI
MAVRPKPASTPTAQGKSRWGSTASLSAASTTSAGPSATRPAISTPAGPLNTQPATSNRLLRKHSLILRAKGQATLSTPTTDNFSLAEKPPNFEKRMKEQQEYVNQNEGFPLRRDFGLDSRNKAEKIHTNHFRLTLPNVLYRYTIGLTKVCSGWSQAARKRLIETCFNDVNHFDEQERNFATDYLLNIVSWKELEFPPVDKSLGKEAKDSIYSSLANDNLVFSKKILFGRNEELVAIYSHGPVDLSSLKKFVSGQADYKDHDNSIACQSLNIIISKAARGTTQPNFEAFQLGSNRLFIKSRWDPLDTDLNELHRKGHERSKNLVVCHHGFSFTVKPAMGDVLLNVNSATSAFFHPRRVSDFIKYHSGTPTRYDRLLLGVRVYVNYRGQPDADKDEPSNRIKTINGFGSSLCQETFEKDGKTITVYDYLVAKYPKQQPIDKQSVSVNLGGKGKDKRKLWYAPEMLQILPYQPYRAKFTPDQTTNMINQACKKPFAKVPEILNDGLGSIGMGVSTVYGQSSLRIDPHMLTVPSRQVPEPRLTFIDSGSQTTTSDVRQGKWTLPRGAKFFNTTTGVGGGLHYIFVDKLRRDISRNEPQPEDIHAEFIKVLRGLGIRFRLPDAATYTAMTNDGSDEIRRGLSEAQKHGASLVILLMKNSSTPAYSEFKTVADRGVGMQSICLAKYWKSKNKAGYLTNVGMKVNLKLGNVNTSIGTGFGTAGAKPIDETVMILGADVTHPSAMSSRGTPSIAAVVGSVDGTFGKFLGSMRWQQPDEKSDGSMKQSKEIIEDMKSMVSERLFAYYQFRKRLPAKIIYYRDGVSEAQRVEVLNKEVLAIKEAYHQFAASKNLPTTVPVTAVIVTKRHGTRFFPRAQGKIHRDNIVPGTAVETSVTSPYYFDFFLASHAGIQGTSKPAHYFVVENGLKFNASELQNFTQKICAIYVRAMMTVSYASPAYYADRLCERGRIYLREFYDGSPDHANMTAEQFTTRLNAVWNRHRNPWRDNLGGTMFWM